VSRHKQDWEELARVDPCWAIVSDPARRFGNWDGDEFFRSGELQFAEVMRVADRLGYPAERSRVLDFGCGIGRVTRAMAPYFEKCYGLDISDNMVTQARELNRAWPRCEFQSGGDLGTFPDDHFDMVYCHTVLQHFPARVLIEAKISEFVRVLKPRGLIVFQLLSFIPFKYRIQPTRRAYAFFRAIGFGCETLYRHLRLTPIRSTCIGEERILDLLGRLQAHSLEIHRLTFPQTSVRGATYFVTKPYKASAQLKPERREA
jgi:SAM-dependent methyltransferase